MGKKRIPVDKKQFEALKNELERVSGIDLSSDNAYYDWGIKIGGHSAMNIYSLILALMRKKDLMEWTILNFPHCVKMK